MEEAIRRADDAGLVMAPNGRMSQALRCDEWRRLEGLFGCWTGTMVGYDLPDKRLGTSIEYTDPNTNIRYVFPVPKDHVGEKNIALVAEHPDFTLETDGMSRIVQAKDTCIVTEFPVDKDMHVLDPRFSIPRGQRIHRNDEEELPDDVGTISRIEKRVGLASRTSCSGIHSGDGNWQGVFSWNVYMNTRPSDPRGVAVEVAEV